MREWQRKLKHLISDCLLSNHAFSFWISQTNTFFCILNYTDTLMIYECLCEELYSQFFSIFSYKFKFKSCYQVYSNQSRALHSFFYIYLSKLSFSLLCFMSLNFISCKVLCNSIFVILHCDQSWYYHVLSDYYCAFIYATLTLCWRRFVKRQQIIK